MILAKSAAGFRSIIVVFLHSIRQVVTLGNRLNTIIMWHTPNTCSWTITSLVSFTEEISQKDVSKFYLSTIKDIGKFVHLMLSHALQFVCEVILIINTVSL